MKELSFTQQDSQQFVFTASLVTQNFRRIVTLLGFCVIQSQSLSGPFVVLKVKEPSLKHVLLGLLVGEAVGVTGDNVAAGDNVGGVVVGPPIKEQVAQQFVATAVLSQFLRRSVCFDSFCVIHSQFFAFPKSVSKVKEGSSTHSLFGLFVGEAVTTVAGDNVGDDVAGFEGALQAAHQFAFTSGLELQYS